MLKKIIHFFDRLEDKTRHWLSHRPILYAFIGGTGVVLFWRGIWHTADYLTNRYLVGMPRENINTIDLIIPFWWDGMFSLIIGTLLLLFTGLMVSSFIGTEVIIAGLLKRKKKGEKDPKELIEEANTLKRIEDNLEEMAKKIEDIERKMK